MYDTEHQILHGICLRLIHALDVKRPEVLTLARWISERPEVFGVVPPLISLGRRGPILDTQGWEGLAAKLSDRLDALPSPSD